MKRRSIAILLTGVLSPGVLAGCTTLSLSTALGTPANPYPVFAAPGVIKDKDAAQDAVIVPIYTVLLEANDATKSPVTLKTNADERDVRRYIAAGFALSDVYCARFFAKTDEAYRRRRFGRTLTNDVGTVVTTVLGLASAGQNIVTGAASAVGLADSAWRNYDDSFVISPDLSNVQALVFAAQDNFRVIAIGAQSKVPTDYASAQTVILRYANLCTFLGMKALLDQSSGQQRLSLNQDTNDRVNPKTPAAPPPLAGDKAAGEKAAGGKAAAGPAAPGAAAPSPAAIDAAAPSTALPSIAPNVPPAEKPTP